MKNIVIGGAGFAGLAAAKELRHSDAEVLLVDRANHNLFQPLLYQVATTLLSPAQIASPIFRSPALDGSPTSEKREMGE